VTDQTSSENSAAVPVDAKLSPAGLVALLGSQTFLFTGLFSLAPALPTIRAHFAADPNADLLIQIVGTTGGFAFAIGSLTIGRLIARIGYRRIYLISLLAFAAAAIAGVLAPNLLVLVLTRAVVGVATAGILNAALVGVARLLSPAAQARALGLQVLIGSVVSTLGFGAVGQLAGIDWRLPFAPHLVALLFVPLVLTLPGLSEESKSAPRPAARGVEPMILLTAAFSGVALFGSVIFGPLYLSALGVTNTGLLSIPPMAATVGSLVGSVLYISLRPRVGPAEAFAFGLAFVGAGLMTIALSGSVWGVAAGTLITLLGCSTVSPNLNSAAILASPENSGPALGLVNALNFGAMILGPFIMSPLIKATGGPRVALLSFAAFAGMLAVLFIFGRKRQQTLSA
jgi:MFS family permease